ncbi:hypothetical protein P8A22_37900 (plasmid) [Streptomyces laculatispora]|uniref:Lipoprotein n=1 Tax=Streptomyces laculatispora TaxID=887464 RepID=A0ABY9IG75_9ACTN|nr:hypothetical protein [Streptomyces laculatispora]WLQ45604.1 hypothetical protein P8A22_37900 [Streptomyces laculatispora]
MITHSLRVHRRAASAVLVTAAALVLVTGCADEPPSGHQERLRKAAGVASFKITCTKDLWERTKSGRDQMDSHEDAKPRSLHGPAKDRGLVEITLTGAQLVDYLKTLEEDISGGPLADRSIEELSRRMYEAIAPVVDRVQKGKPPTEVPQAVVDDAVVQTGPTPSPS